MKIGSFFLFSLMMFLLFGCSGLVHKRPSYPEDLAETQTLLTSLTQRNNSLKSFKGTGRVSVTREGREYFSRLAWAGAMPSKLRFELFGLPGQPKTGFSSDGEWLYYFNPQNIEHPIRKISSKDPNLERFISIPITAREIVTLLSGRIPDYAHHTLDLRNHKFGQGYVLTLKKRWWSGAQKIYLDPTKKKIQKIEAFQGSILVYRAEFAKMQTIQGYQVPSRLIISNDKDTFFILDIDRYWANVSVHPDMFRLNALEIKE